MSTEKLIYSVAKDLPYDVQLLLRRKTMGTGLGYVNIEQGPATTAGLLGPDIRKLDVDTASSLVGRIEDPELLTEVFSKDKRVNVRCTVASNPHVNDELAKQIIAWARDEGRFNVTRNLFLQRPQLLLEELEGDTALGRTCLRNDKTVTTNASVNYDVDVCVRLVRYMPGIVTRRLANGVSEGLYEIAKASYVANPDNVVSALGDIRITDELIGTLERMEAEGFWIGTSETLPECNFEVDADRLLASSSAHIRSLALCLPLADATKIRLWQDRENLSCHWSRLFSDGIPVELASEVREAFIESGVSNYQVGYETRNALFQALSAIDGLNGPALAQYVTHARNISTKTLAGCSADLLLDGLKNWTGVRYSQTLWEALLQRELDDEQLERTVFAIEVGTDSGSRDRLASDLLLSKTLPGDLLKRALEQASAATCKVWAENGFEKNPAEAHRGILVHQNIGVQIRRALIASAGDDELEEHVKILAEMTNLDRWVYCDDLLNKPLRADQLRRISHHLKNNRGCLEEWLREQNDLAKIEAALSGAHEFVSRNAWDNLAERFSSDYLAELAAKTNSGGFGYLEKAQLTYTGLTRAVQCAGPLTTPLINLWVKGKLNGVQAPQTAQDVLDLCEGLSSYSVFDLLLSGDDNDVIRELAAQEPRLVQAVLGSGRTYDIHWRGACKLLVDELNKQLNGKTASWELTLNIIDGWEGSLLDLAETVNSVTGDD